MWRANFIPNISLIAKDGKEPLKFIVTLSFLPVYSIAIVKAVNLANCWKQVTRIAPRASDESPKKWPKNKKIRTEASELTEACILSAHRLFLKLWKLLEGSSSCQIFRSTEMVLDWRGIQLLRFDGLWNIMAVIYESLPKPLTCISWMSKQHQSTKQEDTPIYAPILWYPT